VTFAWIDIVYILAAFMAGLQVSVAGRLAQGGGQPQQQQQVVMPTPGRRGRQVSYRRSVALAR
jgi:hypothetical protein